MRDSPESANQLQPGDARERFEWVQRVLGYALAACGLIWVLYDVHPAELLAHLTIRNWGWAAAAIGVDMLSFLAQGWRWSLLLSPLGNLRPLRATQAVYAGLFTNEVLPLHIGEIVRAYLVSRWMGVPFATVLPSIAVERLLDGVWLVLGIGAAAVLMPLPANIEDAADIFGIAVLVCVVFFLCLVYWKRDGKSFTTARFPFLNSAVAHFRQIAVSGHLLPAFLISLFMIGLQALAFWMVMPAYGLDLSLWAGAVVFFIVHIGTAIPNAPGNVGSYQFLTVLGLTLFGIDKPTAAGFSFVVFFVLSLPLWIIGFLAFSRTGLTINALRTQMGKLARKSH